MIIKKIEEAELIEEKNHVYNMLNEACDIIAKRFN